MTIQLNFDDSGGTDEPIVLINGLFQTIASWTQLQSSLSRYARIIRIDLMNQGGSPSSDGPYTVDAHARDIVRLLTELGCHQAHVVGHSYGTRIAMRVARQLGSRAQSLVLVGASAPALHERYLMIFRNWAHAIRAGHGPDIINAVVPWVYGGHYLQANAGLVNFYAKHLVDNLKDGRTLKNLEGLIASYENFHAEDESGAGIRARTVILNGAEDAVTPPSCLAASGQSFFNARVVTVPKAGHALVAERPDLVEEEILKAAL